MSNKLDLAEAQMLGWKHGHQGYDLESLCSSMGLTRIEWEKIKEKYPISYFEPEDLKEIEDYLNQRKDSGS